MNRPYLHSLLTNFYTRLREVETKLIELNKEHQDVLESIAKSEKEFDELGDYVAPQEVKDA